MVRNALCTAVRTHVRNGVRNAAGTTPRPDQTRYVLTKVCGLPLVTFIFKAKERTARDSIGLAR